MPVSQHCARPGCSGTTAAWLTYDYGSRTVWLDDRDSGVGGSLLGLCAAHGDRLRVPLGWFRRDRRTAVRPTGLGWLMAPRDAAHNAAHRRELDSDTGSPPDGGGAENQESLDGQDGHDTLVDGSEAVPPPAAVAV